MTINENKIGETSIVPSVNTEIIRMDLNNPTTIFSYGSSVLDDYEAIKNAIPSTFTNMQVKDYEFSEPIRVINDFNRTLNGEETNKTRQRLKKNKLASGLCNAINRVSKGNIDLLRVNDHSAEDYYSYMDAARDLCVNMTKEKESLEEDILELTEFKEYVKQVAQNLDVVIQIGLEDMVVLENKVDEVKENDPTEYKTKLAFLDLARQRIASLKSSETLMKNVISQIDLANALAAEQHIKYDEFLQVTAPTVGIYARLATRIKRDKKRLERFNEVKESINNTIQTASINLTSNIEGVIELGSDNVITKETLTKSAEEFKKGADMMIRYQSEKTKNTKSLMTFLQELDAVFQNYSDSIVDTKHLLGTEAEGKSPKRLGSL